MPTCYAPTPLNDGTTPDVEFIGPTDAMYPAALRQAHEFLRRHGRYTPRTLNALLAAGDIVQEARETGSPIPFEAVPSLFTAGRPSSYDPDTEVKQGGIMGVVAVWEGTKVLLGVGREKRRQGVGRCLLQAAQGMLGYGLSGAQAWVGQHNTEGQMFLLSQGWRIASLNSSGAVCFAVTEADIVEERDDIVSAVRARRGRRTDWESVVNFETTDDF
jgi:hypothetical protein